jgi:hypothetical protein
VGDLALNTIVLICTFGRLQAALYVLMKSRVHGHRNPVEHHYPERLKEIAIKRSDTVADQCIDLMLANETDSTESLASGTR